MTTPRSLPFRTRPWRSGRTWLLALLATALAAASWLRMPGSQAQPAPAMTLVPAPAASAAASPAPSVPSPAEVLAALPAPSGEAIAHTCAACHGTQGRLGDEAFVPLAGMPAAQFVRTMQDFRSGARPSTLMGHVARGFTDTDLQAMAAYFASIPAGEGVR